MMIFIFRHCLKCLNTVSLLIHPSSFSVRFFILLACLSYFYYVTSSDVVERRKDGRSDVENVQEERKRKEAERAKPRDNSVQHVIRWRAFLCGEMQCCLRFQICGLFKEFFVYPLRDLWGFVVK